MEFLMQLRGRPQGRRSPGKLNSAFLPLTAHRLHFINQLTQRQEELPAADENASVESRWCQLRDAVDLTALGVLGRTRRQRQDWFDESNGTISNLLAEKNSLHGIYVNDPADANKAAFFPCRRLAQQRLQEIQDAWMARKAEWIQMHAGRNETKNLDAAKVIYGSPTKGTAPVISSDGPTLLMEKSHILKGWNEHFRRVLNLRYRHQLPPLLPQVKINTDMDFPTSLLESICAAQQPSGRGAPS
ncbi:hypothetical protein SprV_0200777900 [Sparganum proliferum]